MALTFDLTKIHDYKKLCYTDDDLNPITKTILFLTMFVGVGELRGKKLDEFVDRAMAYEKVAGPFLTTSLDDGCRPRSLSEAELRAHEGLVTNVSYESPAVFKKKLASLALEKCGVKGVTL
jgi:hypothetical protein